MFKNLSSKLKRKSLALISTAALLFVGISAQASGILNTPAGGYVVCIDSKTKVVTHPGSSKCKAGQKRLILGAQGASGIDGLTGAAGLPGKDGKTLWNGIQNPENTLGAPGDMYINSVAKTLFGPKNLDGTWPAGVSMVGPAGPAGSPGAAGANGSNATIAITELFLCDGSDSDDIANEKCKIGMTGPGGGIIFFVDYNDIYADFNYLEAAYFEDNCVSDYVLVWTSNSYDVNHARTTTESSWRVGRGVANTAAMLETREEYYEGDPFEYEADASGAAHHAENFDCEGEPGYKTDWFLGSLGEMKLLLEAAYQVSVRGASNIYWTSNSVQSQPTKAFAIGVESGTVTVRETLKTEELLVRPIRRF
jgi:hypothetical protein